jgi:hypothetical protein
LNQLVEAVSAKLNPDASIVSSSVALEICLEISALNLATETTSVSPDSVITGPDSPAATVASSLSQP